MPDCPLQQHPDYGDAIRRMGYDVQRHTDYGTGLTMVLQRRRFGPLTLALASRGPVWEDRPRAGRLARITDRRTLLVVNAERPEDEAFMRASGLMRVMTPSYVAELPLCDDPAQQRRRLGGKWRNQLCRAEEAGLSVKRSRLTGQGGRWFLAQATAFHRARRISTYPAPFLLGLARTAPRLLRLWLAERDGRPLAGVLTAQTDGRVSYLAGWNGAEGRGVNAHNLLIWRVISRACDEGQTTLDLGVADDETAAGLTRFKRGTGAVVRPLGGTWLAGPRYLMRRQSAPQGAGGGIGIRATRSG